MAAFDWASTPLGPPAGWPQSLRSALSIGLNSNFPIAVYWGRDLVLLYNDEWSPILGGKHPWALGRPAREAWPEIWHIIEPLFGRVMATGEAVRSRDQLLPMHRHGFTEECYFDYTFSPVRGEGGRVEGVFNAVLETTTRVIGERRLRTLRGSGAWESGGARSAEDACRTAARTLAENPHDLPFVLLYLLDGDGRRATLAGSTGPAPGGPAGPAAVGLGDPDAPWPFGRVAATGKPVEVGGLADRFGSLPGGVWPEPPRRAVVLPMAAPGADRPAGFVVAGVSPRLALDDAYRGFLDLVAGHVGAAVANARAFEAEKQRAEALAAVDRAKTAFFSNVSHEFRTPLTLMLGPVDDILAKPAGEVLPANRELLEVVRRNGRRLQKLVNTLLDFSRIEAGRARARFAPTDLAALTADLASNFRSACEAAGLRLVVDCPPLPGPVHADREMWEKVVLNLLSNAFKFTFSGEIRVTVRSEGGRAVLTVADTGTGIPPADLPRVFDRFHRVEGSRGRTHEGTGIGLALVRELVGLHGGTVGVESTVGEGTTFTVAVPFGTAHLPADQLAAGPTAGGLAADAFVEEAVGWLPGSEDRGQRTEDSEGSPTSPSSVLCPLSSDPRPDGPRPRVLLADDNADMRGYVRRLLAGRYAVEAVADGRAALEAAKVRRPDLVLTDVMMPRLDGFGLLAALRADPATADLPVVLLSARAGEEARVEGLRAGADDYLVKPFSAGELVARVDGLLALAAARREAAARRAETVHVLESITEGFAALDRDWRVTYFNAAAERLNGVRRENVLGRTHWELYPATIGTELERQYRRAMADRVAVRFENYYEPWGRWFEVSLHPLTDGGLAVYWRDITGAKRTEEAVRASEERFRELADAMPQIVYVTGPGGGIEFINRRWAEYTGQAEADAAGLPAVVHPDDLPGLRAAWAAAVAAGAAMEAEFRLRRTDGAYRWFLARSVPIRDGAGAVARWYGTSTDIDDQKRAEQALAEAQRVAGVGSWEWDAATDRNVVSDELCRIYGLPPGRPIPDFAAQDGTMYPHDSWVRLNAAVQESLRTGVGYCLDIEALRGGERIWVTARSEVVRDPAGRVTGLRGTVQDVTARKRAEDALRQHAAEVDTLLDTLPIGVFFAHDPDCRVITGNRAGRELLRIPPADDNLSKTATEGDRPTHFRVCRGGAEVPPDQLPVQRAARGEVVSGDEVDQVFDDGTVLHTVVTAAPLYDPAGRVRGAVAGILDVTARKRAEDALRHSEGQLRTVTDAARVGLVIVDEAHVYRFANRAYGEVLGLPPEEIVGRRVADVLAPVYEEQIRPRLVRAFAGERVGYELTVPPGPGDPDGRTRYCAVAYEPQLDPDGSRRVVVVVVDITARVEAERGLKEADRRKDEFLALLAHELRNPLAPIRNGLQVLRLAPPGSDPAGKARDMMDRQLTHLVRLVDDLLDVSRITRGKLDLRKGPTTLAEVVAAAVESAGPAVEAAGHALTVALPPDPVPLDADLTRLAQVFANLLTNSAKYTPKGGRVGLTAELGTRSAEPGAEDPADGSGFRAPGSEFVTVAVRDTGLGIPAEFIPRLFDMFSQVDRGVEKATGGLGIGLALVKGLVEMHGGTVAAESPGPGQGSTFTVRLPVARNPEPGTRNGEPGTPAEDGSSLRVPGSGFRARRRVLVVDDNRDAAESLAEMLRLLGNEVVTAHDGLEAVAAAERVRPDVVLMDIGMPRLNGLDATRRIRREPWGAGMTILALTGWGQDDDRARSRAAGCDGHLVKPVALPDLAAAVAAGRNGVGASRRPEGATRGPSPV